jgi:hypothetical protein
MLCQSPVTCSPAEGVGSKIIFAGSADEHREIAAGVSLDLSDRALPEKLLGKQKSFDQRRSSSMVCA